MGRVARTSGNAINKVIKAFFFGLIVWMIFITFPDIWIDVFTQIRDAGLMKYILDVSIVLLFFLIAIFGLLNFALGLFFEPVRKE